MDNIDACLEDIFKCPVATCFGPKHNVICIEAAFKTQDHVESFWEAAECYVEEERGEGSSLRGAFPSHGNRAGIGASAPGGWLFG